MNHKSSQYFFNDNDDILIIIIISNKTSDIHDSTEKKISSKTILVHYVKVCVCE